MREASRQTVPVKTAREVPRAALGPRAGGASARAVEAAIVATVCIATGAAFSYAAGRPAIPGPETGVPGKGTLRPAGTGNDSREYTLAMKEEAVRVAKQAPAEFPEDPRALVLAGNTYHWLGRNEDAMTCWRKALDLGAERADVLYAMSRLALGSARYNEAERLGLRALAMAPRMPGIRTAIASALIHLGQPAKAIPLLEAEVRLGPDAVPSHYLLGRACFQTGDYRRARRHYQTVLAARPNHKNACYGLATVCARLGQAKQALRYRKRFQEIKRKDLGNLIDETTSFNDAATVRRHLARTHSDAGLLYRKHGQADAAATHWRRAAELNPKAVDCRKHLARLYASTGRYDDALALYARLTELEPKNPAHLTEAGAVHLRLKAFAAAEQAFREARRLAPGRALGHRALAQFYLQTNQRPGRALELARYAVGLEPNATNFFVLGQAHARNGNREAARRALREAVQRDLDNPLYRKAYEEFRAKLQPG